MRTQWRKWLSENQEQRPVLTHWSWASRLQNCEKINFYCDSSVSKESACNAGHPSLIPGSGRSPGEGKGYPLQSFWASLVAQLVKNPPTRNAGSLGSTPELGRYHGEGKGYPLQYYGLENSMDGPWARKAHGTQLSDFYFHCLSHPVCDIMAVPETNILS